MAHKYMSYSRDSGGVVTRNHKVLVIEDVSDYRLKEHLRGWPEKCVFWRVMADMSCVGIAPMSDAAENKMTHYHMFNPIK